MVVLKSTDELWGRVLALDDTQRCIIAGCGWIVADEHTQTCETHFHRWENVRMHDGGTSQFRYPCKECQTTRWFNSVTSRCVVCRRDARPYVPPPPPKPTRHYNCMECQQPLNKNNSKALRAMDSPQPQRCGRCYLKWKAQERKRKGER